MTPDQRYPSLLDLKARARKRIPHFVWEFLESATGAETVTGRNRAALDAVLFRTSVLHGEIAPNLACRFLGRNYPVPFGIAPLGMSGLIWPQAERILAGHATKAGIPYGLSTVATRTPDELADVIGDQGWFQMYPPRDAAIRADMLDRAKRAGFTTLVLTLDVPAASRRERQTRGGLVQPPRLTPRLAMQVARCPTWTMGIARSGMPRMRLVDSYAPKATGILPSTAHVGYLLRTSPDWAYLNDLRKAWHGPLVVKGVLHPEDAPRLAEAGVDAIWVSNHAGRQFDGAHSSVDALRQIRAATDMPLIHDSGIGGGLDIMRALALGADMVMMGRPWHYALGALGAAGPAHLHQMLVDDMKSNMAQIGAATLSDLPSRLL